MSIRRDVADAIAAFFTFGKVKAPHKAADHTVHLDVAGDAGQNVPDCERWGDAALLHHPVAGAETLCLDLEDELVVIATRDRRWQIETSPGETVVRAVGAASPAYIKLKPDGTCEVHATRVDLGAAALSDAQRVAIGALVDARLTRLQAAFDAHAHATAGSIGTPSAPTPVLGVIPVGPLASVAASKTRAQ